LHQVLVIAFEEIRILLLFLYLFLYFLLVKFIDFPFFEVGNELFFILSDLKNFLLGGSLRHSVEPLLLLDCLYHLLLLHPLLLVELVLPQLHVFLVKDIFLLLN